MKTWYGMGLLLAGLLLAACGASTTPPPTEEPQPGDLERGPVFVDQTQVVVRESYPAQLALIVTGSLPTPCHELKYDVSGPDAEGRIEIDLFTLVDTSQVCVQVTQPFEETIELGSYTSGQFTILLNGEEIDTIGF